MKVNSLRRSISLAIPEIELEISDYEVMMELYIRGYLTKEQYFLGMKVLRRAFVTGKMGKYIDLWKLEFIAGGILAVIGLGMGFNGLSGFGVILLLMGCVFAYLGFMQYRIPEKQWENIKEILITGTVTDDGIVLKTRNGQNNYQWEDLASYGEGDDVVVLAPKNTFIGHIIPRNFFKDSQSWLMFKSLLAEKVPRTSKLPNEGEPMDRSQIFFWVFVGVAALALLFQASR